jgi:hypothetical protein
MACHVYDLDFRWIMTITICDMQSEDSDSQSVLWFGIVEHMKIHGVNDISFRGFVVDIAHAN